ncbi:MAG: fibronectin type III-like domain-contianing protein [Treponema sp.]|nr:fibronectin type III-like domain-contianing protein [Treponema sp.]
MLRCNAVFFLIGSSNCSNIFIRKKITSDSTFEISADVQNTGKSDGDEVVQLYIAKEDRSKDDPACSLRAFSRVSIKQGAGVHVSFKLDSHAFESINGEGESVLVPGTYIVTIADAAPLPCSRKPGAAVPVTAEIVIY